MPVCINKKRRLFQIHLFPILLYKVFSQSIYKTDNSLLKIVYLTKNLKAIMFSKIRNNCIRKKTYFIKNMMFLLYFLNQRRYQKLKYVSNI